LENTAIEILRSKKPAIVGLSSHFELADQSRQREFEEQDSRNKIRNTRLRNTKFTRRNLYSEIRNAESVKRPTRQSYRKLIEPLSSWRGVSASCKADLLPLQ
jgi:hypothetical protein